MSKQLLLENAKKEWGSQIKECFPGIEQNTHKFNLMCEHAYIASRQNATETSQIMNVSGLNTLNENSTFPTWGNPTVPGNVVGMGNPTLPSNPSGHAGMWNGTRGSGDKWPTLVQMALQVAAATPGLDLVRVINTATPNYMIPYHDFIYAGGKIDSTNCEDKPQVFEVDWENTNLTLTVGDMYWGVNTDNQYGIQLQYVGRDEINGFPIFRVGKTFTDMDTTPVPNPAIKLYEIFDRSDNVSIHNDNNGAPGSTSDKMPAKIEYVNALQNHIQGFSGSGVFDEDPWKIMDDGQTPFEPMSRGTGENEYPREINSRAMVASGSVGTIKITGTYTIEQQQDMYSQFGYNIAGMTETALINELSQSINKDVLSVAYKLGWTNNWNLYRSQGITLNMTVDPTITTPSTASYIDKGNFLRSIPVPAFKSYQVGGTAFENQETMQRRIVNQIIQASAIITTVGRRGAPNCLVIPATMLANLQNVIQYNLSPFEASMAQNNAQGLYPIGTLLGMTVYVNPQVSLKDTRILVHRRPSDTAEDFGLALVLYKMAEIVNIIVEGTFSAKMLAMSRYSVVTLGHYPELLSYVFCVNGANIFYGN